MPTYSHICEHHAHPELLGNGHADLVSEQADLTYMRIKKKKEKKRKIDQEGSQV